MQSVCFALCIMRDKYDLFRWTLLVFPRKAALFRPIRMRAVSQRTHYGIQNSHRPRLDNLRGDITRCRCLPVISPIPDTGRLLLLSFAGILAAFPLPARRRCPREVRHTVVRYRTETLNQFLLMSDNCERSVLQLFPTSRGMYAGVRKTLLELLEREHFRCYRETPW